jgi:hypothetical protein
MLYGKLSNSLLDVCRSVCAFSSQGLPDLYLEVTIPITFVRCPHSLDRSNSLC